MKIVIIGASTAGHTVAEKLREKDPQAEIILLTEEPFSYYDRNRLPEFLSGAIKEKELFLAGDEWYRAHSVTLLKERKVVSLNCEKRVITCKEKEKIEFDYLVVASGRRYVVPEIPGAKKEGVFVFNALGDCKDFLKRVVIHPVGVIGSSEFALAIARAIIKKYSVEVKLMSDANVDSSALVEGIEVINSSIEEIIGEGEAQAVKLKEGKVIGLAAVVFLKQVKSNLEFLKNTSVVVQDDFIVSDAVGRTSDERVFAVGSVTQRQGAGATTKTSNEVYQEAALLADHLSSLLKGETCPTS
ncbi:MAG: FAD-dependent oxidoreductase [Candidatus Omnitrophica bacterium]|nr:FAD-dependent oxidoreductase [Candidatus Omnitrophota bacterium]